MAKNPCFCMPLQKGIQIMAMIDIILGIANLVLAIIGLIAITSDKKKYEREHPDNDAGVAIAVFIVLIILAVLGLLLALRLYYGAKNRDRRNCKIWLIVTFVLFCLNLLSLITSGVKGDSDAWDVVILVITLVYQMYMMFCVYCFIKELREDQERYMNAARFEGAWSYPMYAYPPPGSDGHGPVNQQPAVFITSTGQNGPMYPPPPSYSSATATGIPNPNYTMNPNS